ncbi:hypothetical protein CBL_02285 [Carabus blaptoides fortunei]
MNNHTNAWFFLGAAVVGLVSAAGVYLVEHFRQERRRHVFTQDLTRLDNQLSNLRKELDVLRQLQKDRNNSSTHSKQSRRKVRNSSTLSVTSTEEYRSAVDEDSSDLEFYDLSSDEDNTSNTSSILDKELKDIDKLLDNEVEYLIALKKLEELNNKFLGNADILWRLGRALKLKINQTTDSEERKQLICKGVDCCELATQLKPNCASCHKWMAVLVGLKSEFLPINEKLINGQLFKRHVEEALSLTPNDSALHHMLGRYAYEFAKISWFERSVASTLFGEVPNYSYQDALNLFLEAEKLSTRQWKENRLYIAKCELAIGQTDSAVEWLNKAENSTSEEEDKVHEEVRSLLQKHKQR